MRIDIAHSTESSQQQVPLEHLANESSKPRVLQIEPEDTFESVLMALFQQSEPVVIILPEEQSLAFSDPSHFAQLQKVRTPKEVTFLIPQSRVGLLAHDAQQYGFTFASSLEKASQFLQISERELLGMSQLVLFPSLR